MQPGFTTFVAYCNKPTRGSVSSWLSSSLTSLLAGCELFVVCLLAGVPSFLEVQGNVRLWEGLSTFSRAGGMPSIEHAFLIVTRLCIHVEEPGGLRVKKSSK